MKGSKPNKSSDAGNRLVCRNPKALKRYDIEERVEAGMVLQGSEVKSLRQRQGDLDGAFASIDGTEVFLHKMHIAPYEQAGHFGHDPKRSRKLLLHRSEIERMRGRLTMQGMTLVPLEVCFKKGYAKVLLGLGRGRKLTDRREEIRKAEDLREARVAMRRAKQG